MKQIAIMVVLALLLCNGQAQTVIYARFINYNSQVLKPDGSSASGTLITANTIDPSSPELFKLTTFTENVEQTLNIGSQSTGVGAGRIAFHPITLSRPVDGASPLFFQLCASGTPYQTMEVFFTDASGKIAAKQLFKLVAIKTIAWAAASCTNDCPLVIENISLEYGGQIESVYKAGNTYLSTPIVKGWNIVRNIADNDPNAVIK